MQRPRRTTEFHGDVPGTSTRKSRRNPSPGPPSTLQKMPARQSRIAVPIRSSSSDRSSAAALLSLPQPSSILRNRPTPIKTPLRKSGPAPRALFTAEKQRNVANTGLHNDKKWVHDQIQRITDHLSQAVLMNAIPGISSDFFNRSSALKQMSIKQFVAIINYFLQFIWGNRFMVGTNHVADLVNILQKLNYPYPLNKSWMKTPNTQHSFGNVIVLLDFLMDFVPPQDEEQEREMQFPLLEQPMVLGSMVDNHIPDIEFQSLLLIHSEEGFKLWDKQLMHEFSALQQQTCDVIIRKRCNVDTLDALNTEIEILKRTLDELSKQMSPISKVAEEKFIKLEEDLKNTMQQIAMTEDELKSGEHKVKELTGQIQLYISEAQALQDRIAHMETAIKQQVFTREQRDEYIRMIAELRQLIQSQDRAKQDMESRNLHQQVLYSRAQKQLTDQVESFNTYMREICYSQMLADSLDLQIPFKPEKKDLEGPVSILTQLKDDLKTRTQQMSDEKIALDAKIAKLTQGINNKLEPTIKKLTTTVTCAQKRLQQIGSKNKKERDRLNDKLQQLEEKIHQLRLDTEMIERLITQKQQELIRLKYENEETMTKAEEEYRKCAEERSQFLDEYASTLRVAQAELKNATEYVETAELELEAYQKELERKDN